MNWIFAFLLGWHPPLEIPPAPPLDWSKRKSIYSDLFFHGDAGYFDIQLHRKIVEPPTHEVLRLKTPTTISIPYGPLIILVTPEQMAILETSYPKDQVHCDIDVIFYAPDK